MGGAARNFGVSPSLSPRSSPRKGKGMEKLEKKMSRYRTKLKIGKGPMYEERIS